VVGHATLETGEEGVLRSSGDRRMLGGVEEARPPVGKRSDPSREEGQAEGTVDGKRA
jgi:hypothetical protein